MPGISPQQRPLRALPRSLIDARWRQALSAQDGEGGAHCIHELWMRGELGFDVDAALEQLWQHAAGSVPEWLPMRHFDWLATAYEVCAGFEAPGGRSNLYLVLLDYLDRSPAQYGVYVGMSSYPPAQRFDQHKAGIRAAGSVLKRGLEVLTGPVLHLQHIRRSVAAQIEQQLAVALADAGIMVQGGH